MKMSNQKHGGVGYKFKRIRNVVYTSKKGIYILTIYSKYDKELASFEYKNKEDVENDYRLFRALINGIHSDHLAMDLDVVNTLTGFQHYPI